MTQREKIEEILQQFRRVVWNSGWNSPIEQLITEGKIGWHKQIDGVCLVWNDKEQIWQKASLKGKQ